VEEILARLTSKQQLENDNTCPTLVRRNDDVNVDVNDVGTKTDNFRSFKRPFCRIRNGAKI